MQIIKAAEIIKFSQMNKMTFFDWTPFFLEETQIHCTHCYKSMSYNS